MRLIVTDSSPPSHHHPDSRNQQNRNRHPHIVMDPAPNRQLEQRPQGSTRHSDMNRLPRSKTQIAKTSPPIQAQPPLPQAWRAAKDLQNARAYCLTNSFYKNPTFFAMAFIHIRDRPKTVILNPSLCSRVNSVKDLPVLNNSFATRFFASLRMTGWTMWGIFGRSDNCKRGRTGSVDGFGTPLAY